MKDRIKQRIIITLIGIIIFIPSLIAVSSYYSDDSSQFDITIETELGIRLSMSESAARRLTQTVLKAVSRLQPIAEFDTPLPSKYYLITVKKDSETLSVLRWYLVAQKGAISYARDYDGNIYAINHKDASALLSGSIAFHFYDNSSLPSLSISSGRDIVPQRASWAYRGLGGSMLSSPYVETSGDIEEYAISPTASLSFSVAPKNCTVKLFTSDGSVLSYTSLDDLPTLDIGTRVKIEASWDERDFEGRARYEFLVGEWSAPIYTVKSDSILSGEFFIVTVRNAEDASKIKFKSVPEIYADPIFFSYGESALALVPIKKELSAPCNYTFSFSCGEHVSEISVTVEPRTIRNDKYCSVSLPLSSEELDQAYDLLLETSKRSRVSDGIIPSLLDYSPDGVGAKIADVFYGFGHTVTPTNKPEPYRLDGVIYIFPDRADIPAMGNGEILASGCDSLWGQYVAIDHGMGLITWYFGMSEIYYSVGDLVSEGTSVGRSGNVGFDQINGVYLITTANGIPVSPYPLQNEG